MPAQRTTFSRTVFGSPTRRQFVVGSALTAAALSAGVRPTLAADKTLVVGASVFPPSLKSGLSSYQSLALLTQTHEALVLRDDDGKINPGLAVSWEQLDDTTMRFHLRQGVKFHDGMDFTADDVVFTINRIIDPQSAYAMLIRIGKVTGATLVDKYTVDLHTNSVFPTLLTGLSDIIIEPKHYYEKVGADAVPNHPIGTGPFVYQKWTAGDRYELTANKEYWGGAPKVDNLVIREIPESSVRIASLLAGETHIIQSVPFDLISQVNASSNAKVDEVTTTISLVLTFDTRKPPFDNPKVREAFDYAIDKETLQKELLKGTGEILQGQLLTSKTFGFNPDLKARPFDPDKARQLLKEAGYDGSKPFAITTQSGKYPSDIDICNAVVGMLGNVGVSATLNVVEGGVWLKMAGANEPGPMYMVGWYSLGDADFATTWFTTPSKRAQWTNPEYEKLFIDARSTNDKAARLKAYNRMMEIMHEENPSVFLFGLPSLWGASKSISGFGAPPDEVFRLSKVELA